MKLFIVFLFIFSSQYGITQINKPAVHALYIELGKNGIVANIYYDHKLSGTNFGFRVGLGSNFAKYLSETTGSIGGYYLVGGKTHYLETGVDAGYLSIHEISDDQRGFTFIVPYENTNSFYATFNAGYRVVGKHMIFRLGVAPGIIKNDIIPGAYISIGAVF